ncbi:hypothetical protein P7C71_g1642, partial [Lecanoromycetidae sp. Uapishka_2]
MTMATLPYLRAAYNEFYERILAPKEKAWMREIQPRAGESGHTDAEQNNDDAEVEVQEGVDFELDVQVEIVEEQEVPEGDQQPIDHQQQHEQPAGNPPQADPVEAFDVNDADQVRERMQRHVRERHGHPPHHGHGPEAGAAALPGVGFLLRPKQTAASVISALIFPTVAAAMVAYADTIERIQSRAQAFEGDYAFLADYKYELGADQLTPFGEMQMVNSGADFFTRYADLAITAAPFIRASGQQRVIESAERFGQGYHTAKVAGGNSHDTQYPYDIVVISEDIGSNNTLDHGLCTNFELSDTGHGAQSIFTSTFIPSITTRLNIALPDANLTDQDTIYLMDLCPFETVASLKGTPSLFCTLFTQEEWEQYNYYQTLGKYYGYGPGTALGPSQGVGFANELIARLTGKPVVDHTSVNQTLDADPTTFPLGRTLYADFGHDNDMTAAFAALGLYNSTPLLPKTHSMTVEQMNGYSAAWTVPFAARAVFEKMQCEGAVEEAVRVLVNGRVLPLQTCGGDTLGRCPLSRFVDSLSFAQGGGHWDRCFSTRGGQKSVT